MSKIEDLFRNFEEGFGICCVCSKGFTLGEGVLGDPEDMDELQPEDRTYEPIEFCSQKCKNEYYRAGRK
jgi:hypothetical protein